MTPTLQLQTVNEACIEAWAKTNPERALKIGLRLFQNRTPEELEALHSLGDDEDVIEAWAIAQPMRAGILIMRMMPLFQAQIQALSSPEAASP